MFCLKKIGRLGEGGYDRNSKTFLSVNGYGSLVLLFNLLGWNIKKIYIERLNDVVKRAERVVGVGLAPVKSIYPELLGRKLHQVCEDEEHPLHDVLLVEVVSVVG